MKATGYVSSPGGLAALRNLVRSAVEGERCDLCAAPIAAHHQHLIDPQVRRLLCSCEACAILFTSGGETKYRRVPREASLLDQFALSDQGWNSLAIPIGLAFLFRSSVSGQMLAVYPSPAGPTENAVDEESWQEIVAENPCLAQLTADVEALLVNRMNGAREYLLVPIDECYRLTGAVRKYWRGLSGGEEGWEQITSFFDRLKERCGREAMSTHARSFI